MEEDNFNTIKTLKTRLIKNVKEAVNLDEIERLAISKLTKHSMSYYYSGADDEVTLDRNRKQFNKILLYPKMFINVEKTELSTTILGSKISMPICFAPSATHKLAHFQGEIATAKIAHETGSVLTLSTASSFSIEDVAKANQDGIRWFQLYVLGDTSITQVLLNRAESAGYTAVVVTLDAPILGNRERDLQVSFKYPDHVTYANLDFLYSKNSKTNNNGEADLSAKYSNSEAFEFFGKHVTRSLTWESIEKLRKMTKMKVVVKGIHRVDDALKASEMGVDAIWISNHGGRQLDTVPSSIEMLYAINKALGKRSRVELYVDGGFRRGSDIFKALAFGAKAVFLGRPIIYGLAAGGEEGVRKVLEIMRNELWMTMMLSGCTKISEITSDYVRVKDHFAKF